MLGGDCSGDNIRGQLIFHGVDAVLECEFFFFEPLDSELVSGAGEFKPCDLFIKRTMALLQRHQLIAQFLLLLAVHLFFVKLLSHARATIGLFARFRKSGLKMARAE